MRLLEVELKLLGRVQVVKDHEAVWGLVVSNISKVDAFSRESSHRAVIIEMSSAYGKIFIELDLWRLLLFKMVASTSKSKGVRLSWWTFDIADLDRQVKRVFLGFKRAEQSENMTYLIRFESTLGVLNLEDSKVEIFLVQLFKTWHINLIL